MDDYGLIRAFVVLTIDFSNLTSSSASLFMDLYSMSVIY